MLSLLIQYGYAPAGFCFARYSFLNSKKDVVIYSSIHLGVINPYMPILSAFFAYVARYSFLRERKAFKKSYLIIPSHTFPCQSTSHLVAIGMFKPFRFLS